MARKTKAAKKAPVKYIAFTNYGAEAGPDECGCMFGPYESLEDAKSCVEGEASDEDYLAVYEVTIGKRVAKAPSKTWRAWTDV